MIDFVLKLMLEPTESVKIIVLLIINLIDEGYRLNIKIQPTESLWIIILLIINLIDNVLSFI